MTTGSNNTHNESTRPRRGFWGQVAKPSSETSQEWEPEPEQEDRGLGKPEHTGFESSEPTLSTPASEEPESDAAQESQNVPSWLKWRMAVGEANEPSETVLHDTPEVDDSIELQEDYESMTDASDVEDTASLPRVNGFRKVGFRDLPEVEDSDEDTSSFDESEDRDKSDARKDMSNVPVLEWDDEEQTEGTASAAYIPLVLEKQEDDDESPEVAPENLDSTYVSSGMPEQVNQGRKKRLRNTLIVIAVVLFIGGVYGLGVWFFGSHYLPRTHIGEFDASGMTVGAAKNGLEQETVDYSCTVKVNDFTATIPGGDIGLDRDEESMATEAMQAQSAFAWPIALVAPLAPKVDAKISFSEDALKVLVTNAADDYNDKRLPAENVSIEYDEEAGAYTIEGTTSGEMVDGDEVAKTVISDVREFKRESNPSADACTREATAQDIPRFAKVVQSVNLVRSTDIPILVDGEEATYSSASNNASLVSVGEGPSVVVNEEELSTWAEYTVADNVFRMDDWAYYYLDTETFTKEFAERLANGVVDGYEAPMIDELRTEGASREAAYQHGGWDSSMGRYIDVDLDAQFARLFDNNGEVIWESAFVSGDTYEGHSTVTGLFTIYSMQTNAVLVGMDYDNDGNPDYESFVNYWMPFYGGYGLHDATWRSHFGGDYFAYDGSHGCVNLPYSKAAELYSMTYVGEQVYVHW